jgi:hypothetical protein
VFLRWWNNQAGYAAAIASRGQHFFGTDPGSSEMAIEGTLRHFRPAPVLDLYFDRLLALLEQHAIVAHFVSLPVNQATSRATPPAVVTEFQAYLQRKQERYPGFHVSGPVLPIWEDQWFGDGFSHLNPAGAARFSTRLARCVAAWTEGAPAKDACRTTETPPTDQSVSMVVAAPSADRTPNQAHDRETYR